MDRARRTAEVVGARTGLAVRLVGDLREWDFGECEGLTTEEIEARYPGQLTVRPARDDLTWGWPGGETRAVFYARARRAFGDLVRCHPEQTVAVVSHNGLLTSFLAQAIDGVTWTHPRHDFGHCALAEVEVDDGAVRRGRRVDCGVVD